MIDNIKYMGLKNYRKYLFYILIYKYFDFLIDKYIYKIYK